MKVVYVKNGVDSLVTLPGGNAVRVMSGQHWPADDPAVLLQPSLFTEDPRDGVIASGPRDFDADAPPVESATAAPGERRAARRASG